MIAADTKADSSRKQFIHYLLLEMATGGDIQDAVALAPTQRNFRMAFIGVTGSGKTSLIDLIGNYAQLGGCRIDRMETYRKVEFEEHSGPMQSKTMTCVSYEMKINGIAMDIIDTPGLQDSKGEEKNRTNVENIISTLKNAKYINCICLVTSGRISRFDVLTQKAIKDVLGILPQEVKRNTIIIYTNVSTQCDLSFCHKKLKDELGFQVKPYMLDNAYCGWTKLNSIVDSDFDCSFDEEAEKTALQHSLGKNFKTLDKLFNDIKLMKSVRTDCFGDLRRVSEQIKFKFKELKALEITKKSLQEKIESLSKSLTGTHENMGTIQSRLDYIRTNVVHTTEYNTLCNEKECLKNCHAPCIYTGLITRNVKECKCIQQDGLCSICGHHYSIHAHHRFKFSEEEIKLRSGLRKNLVEAETEEEKSTTLISEQEYQLQTLKYTEKNIELKSEIAILLAEFQRISSKSTYEDIIDAELKTISAFISSFLPFSKNDLIQYLGLNEYREGLIEIQEMPFGSEMTDIDKHTWALKVLDIDPNVELTSEMIHGAFREESKKYHDVIKEGDETIQKRQLQAKDVLKQHIESVV